MDLHLRFRTLTGVLALTLATALSSASANPFAALDARPGAPLAAADAFIPDPAIWRAGTLHVGVRVAPHHYLYQHAFELLEPELVIPMTGGEPHHDEHFGDVVIYRHLLSASIPMASPPESISIRYQGCADIGICYPPQTRRVAVQVVNP